MSDENLNVLVLDNGSGTSKAGFAGDDFPRVLFTTIIGKSTNGNYIGNKIKGKRQALKINHPIQQGIITNWDDMEEIWYHIMVDELELSTLEQPVLLSETPINPPTNREKMAEIMFEKFGVPGLCIANQSMLSLYSCGRQTGIVLDSGYDVTSAVPIYEGCTITNAFYNLGFGGRNLTDYLVEMMREKSYFDISIGRRIEKEVKEKMCFVALDYEDEIGKVAPSTSLSKLYELPDATVIRMCSELFKCPEALFQPSFLHVDQFGIHEAIYTSITKCDEDIRKQLWSNIILAGGSSKFPGIDERLRKELIKLKSGCVKQTDVNLVLPKMREYSAFIGGSKLACSSTFEQMLVSIAEYAENGPRITHYKWL